MDAKGMAPDRAMLVTTTGESTRPEEPDRDRELSSFRALSGLLKFS
jgi:hypothetical protein